MDKTQQAVVSRTKPRKGFALVITLSVLTVVMGLAAVLVSYLDDVREDAAKTKAMIQANIYYADIVNIFNSLKDKEVLFSTLYMAPFPIVSDDGRFVMTLACKPLAGAVNINWLGKEQEAKMHEAYLLAQQVFDFLVEEYELEDGLRLQEMILDEVGIQTANTEYEFGRFRQKNGIMSYQEFSAIVSRYAFEADDKNVLIVPWQKYFSFSGSSKVVDVRYSSAELIALMFDIDVQSVQEWYGDPLKSDLKSFVTMSGGEYTKRAKVLEDKKFIQESSCMVAYEVSGNPYRFGFEYVHGEAKYFEFYGKE